MYVFSMIDGYNIGSFSLTIKLPRRQENTFERIIKQLSEAHLKLKVISDLQVNRLGDLPRLVLRDKSNIVTILLGEALLRIIIRRSHLLGDTIKDQESELDVFSEVQLTQISSEANYIVGSLTSQLQSAEKPLLEGNIELEDSKKYTFDHLVKEQEFKVIDRFNPTVTAIQLSTVEDLWGLKIKSYYEYVQEKERAEGSISFSYELSSPLDLYTILYTFVSKYNNIGKELHIGHD